jgi:hypothetical protein
LNWYKPKEIRPKYSASVFFNEESSRKEAVSVIQMFFCKAGFTWGNFESEAIYGIVVAFMHKAVGKVMSHEPGRI